MFDCSYLDLPDIDEECKKQCTEHLDALVDAIKDGDDTKNINTASDTGWFTKGWSASKAWTTLTHGDKVLMFHYSSKTKNHTGTSQAMEKEGLKTVLIKANEKGLNIENNATDGDLKAPKVYKEVEDETGMSVNQWGDYGHYTKSFRKEVVALADTLVKLGCYSTKKDAKLYLNHITTKFLHLVVFPSKGDFFVFQAALPPFFNHYTSTSMFYCHID